jgi:hypothetical protein
MLAAFHFHPAVISRALYRSRRDLAHGGLHVFYDIFDLVVLLELLALRREPEELLSRLSFHVGVDLHLRHQLHYRLVVLLLLVELRVQPILLILIFCLNLSGCLSRDELCGFGTVDISDEDIKGDVFVGQGNQLAENIPEDRLIVELRVKLACHLHPLVKGHIHHPPLTVHKYLALLQFELSHLAIEVDD